MIRTAMLSLLLAAAGGPARAAGPSVAGPKPLARTAEERRYQEMSPMGARAAGLPGPADPDRGAPSPPTLAKQLLQPILEAAAVGLPDVLVSGSRPGIQSETALAANSNGSILVAGYNDASGFPATSGSPMSISGLARSTDGGTTWAPVPVGPGGSSLLPFGTGQVFGDPDVKYDARNDRFVYSSIYVRPSDGLQGMCLHVSNSGPTAGTSWTGPIEVGPTFVAGHSADKEFIDVNRLTGRILMSWSDFGPTSIAILTTFSDDGGATWSPAAALEAVSTGGVQASVPRFLPGATNATSTAYVVWRYQAPSTGLRNVHCSRSTDGGATWSPPVSLDLQGFAPEDQILGVDRVNVSPAMAVDLVNGQVYVAYQRNAADGTGDVALRTFSGPCAAGSPVLLDASPGSDRAQFYPSVAVDQGTRRVWVSWLDQGYAATGDLTEVMATSSTDAGATWAPPTRLMDRPFHAGYGNDTSQPNLGDYNGSVAFGDRLHAAFGATALAPRFDEGLPETQLLSPDVYFDRRDASLAVLPLRDVSFAVSELNCKAGNGSLDPGESFTLAVNVRNYVTNPATSPATLTHVSAALSSDTPGVTVTAGVSSYPDVAPGAEQQNSPPFALAIAPTVAAGTPIDLTLTLTADQGSIQLPVRLATGSPSTPIALLAEDFQGVAAPALPPGWQTVTPTGSPTSPWVTSAVMTPGSNAAFHGETEQTLWSRLWSPTFAVPSPAGASELLVDFDLAYDLEEEPTQALTAYDGLTLRLFDVTSGLRSVLAEAFATEIKTGSRNHFPRHLPRLSDPAYFQDMSVWSGASGGRVHVAMRFPGAGVTGRTLQLRFEYTQDSNTTCTQLGRPGPCGVAIDNVDVRLVPLVSSPCPISDLSLTATASPATIGVGGTVAFTFQVQNAGPSAATNLVLSPALPPGASFVSAGGTGWACAVVAGSVTCTSAALESGASSAVTLTVIAPLATGTMTGSASVSADPFDPNLADNAAAVTVTVVAASCGNGHVEAGEACDDGNLANGDGCSSTCTVEAGWTCTGTNPSVCQLPQPPSTGCHCGSAGGSAPLALAALLALGWPRRRSAHR